MDWMANDCDSSFSRERRFLVFSISARASRYFSLHSRSCVDISSRGFTTGGVSGMRATSGVDVFGVGSSWRSSGVVIMMLLVEGFEKQALFDLALAEMLAALLPYDS